MTEEDTFHILRRPPKNEMMVLMESEFLPKHRDSAFTEYINAKEKFLKKYGWTIYEFHKARGLIID